jgi:indolepyruvate ferredoxin oxidoreductase alpha subunit
MNLYEEILKNKSGGRALFLLGNEAVARGAIEAGISSATTYPGTPSSEVGDVFAEISEKAGIHFEYSVNEKVALEAAFASSTFGMRSLVFMKHVGMNVAADALMSISYIGTKGGLVVMTADDPSLHSSQNEQDNRHFAELGHIPMLEPSTPQEAKDFTISAFEISEKYGLPVILRTTTMVSHQRSIVKLGPVGEKSKKIVFEKNKGTYNSLPSFAYRNKEKLMGKIRLIEKNEADSFASIKNQNVSEYGVIASGIGYSYAIDIITKYSLHLPILKIGMTNPMPESTIREFLEEHGNIIVIEELDPFIEGKIREIAQMYNITCNIHGKMDGVMPNSYEYNMDIVRDGIFSLLKRNDSPDSFGNPPSIQVLRNPVLCAGCPHRASFFSVRRALRLSGINDVTVSSDIGCYSLGIYEPFDFGDYMVSMGSSTGIASGLTQDMTKKTVSFIGDSTFFHSGIPGLMNAVLNNANTTIVILDNRTTGMTGQQPNPGAMADSEKNLSIEAIVRGIGVKNVSTVDPYDLNATIHAVMDSLKQEGPSVIISRRECAIIRDHRLRKSGAMPVYKVNTDRCSGCMKCLTEFSCPALHLSGKQAEIDPEICDGCGVCSEIYVCPFKAIEVA